VEPFLRWAGGKRWLSRILEGLVPDDYRTYHEPFLGSGAIFFALRPPRAELSDSNDNLINAFETVRDCPEALIKRLGRFDYTREEYYRVRSGNPRTPLARTARFVYLNRTCWNGLYRVDRSGSFNVPYGRRGTFHESDADRIRVASATLRNSRLRHEDFEVALRRVRAGDFVFIDPPYTVTHGDNGFLLYNEKIFSWADQERLAEAIRRIDRKGALFLLTNANHPSVIALYEGFTARPIQRSSILAADPDNRRPVTELLVTNYRVGMREWSLQLAS
jgi:DNA adenine methylase